MTGRHFIVSEKDHAWQHSYRGAITGPFKSRDEAIEDAIDAAQQAEDQFVEVIVQDHDLNQLSGVSALSQAARTQSRPTRPKPRPARR